MKGLLAGVCFAFTHSLLKVRLKDRCQALPCPIRSVSIEELFLVTRLVGT